MESKVIEFKPEPEEKQFKSNKLGLTVYDLQSFLISGALNKSDYIFLMLRLLYGCSKDVEVNLSELADTLSCAGVTPLGKDKEINFTVEDVQVELSKLAKKGILTTEEIPIQLKLNNI